MGNDDIGKDLPGNAAHEEDGAVECYRQGCKMVFVNPGGAEGEQGDPEEEVEVGPEYPAVYVFDDVEEMVVVVPEYAYVEEAEQVGEGYGDKGLQIHPLCAVGDVYFQYHDRDDDGEYTVAECFKPVLIHAVKLLQGWEVVFMNFPVYDSCRLFVL